MDSSKRAIAITGLGMVSSLGHGAIPSCAAARAGIVRAAPLPDFLVHDGASHEPAALIGHPVPGAEGFEGIGKLAVLGWEALTDLMTSAGPGGPPGAGTGLLLALSDGYFIETMLARRARAAAKNEVRSEQRMEYEAKRQQVEARLLPRIRELSGVAFHPGVQRLYFEGHGGFLHAVADAVELLRRRELGACIVGGVDSLLESELLKLLLELRVVKTPERPVGFIPGEGAAFIRLERAEEASKRAGGVLALLEAPQLAREPQHRFASEPSSGVALAEAISRTLQGAAADSQAVGRIMGNLNGDEWRAREWGMVVTREREHVGQVAMWSPAESFGELGAATAAFSLCAAVRAFQRGYSLGRRILVWASSESGLKGAVLVRSSAERSSQEDEPRG
jgi:3-oxoacyl-[acyl-carrier-protein] synthase-1